MWKILALVLLACFGLPLRGPNLIGLATSYGPPAFLQGDVMRNGERLDLNAPIIAVNDCRKDDSGKCLHEWDVSYWPQWANRKAIVFIPECRKILVVDVKDTGSLRSAGKRRLGIRDGVRHYWGLPLPKGNLELAERVLEEPVLETETTWLEDETYWVVADFPVGFYRQEVLCGPIWPVVAIWILEDDEWDTLHSLWRKSHKASSP